MILCIISSLMTVPLIVISGIGFGYSTDNNSYDYDYNRDNHYYSSSVCFALQMLVAMLQAVVAIVASAFSCRVVCGRKSQNTGTVIYYGQTFQPQGTVYILVKPWLLFIFSTFDSFLADLGRN